MPPARNSMGVLEDVCKLKFVPNLCAGPHESDPEVRHIITRMVSEKIPRFRDIPNLLPRLATPVAMARDYARTLVHELGEPKRLDPSLWLRDPFFPLLFATPQEGMALLHRSSPLQQAFFASGVHECFFLLTMHRHEYEILGSELDGEMVKRGVLQTVVSFEDHHIVAATASATQTREAIVAEIVLYLAGLVPEKLRRAEMTRHELQNSEALLKAQLHTLEQAGREHRVFDIPSTLRAKLHDARQELGLLESTLTHLPDQPDDEDYLAQVITVLTRPHEHIQTELVTMHIQDFGIKADKDKGKEIQFIEFTAEGERRLAVLFAGMNRDTAQLVWPEVGTQTR